ncbi:MAG: hypothetical protein CMJ81_10300 [Planctomycetaceae bacterium]|nr:hypothetical protein [Planctomycetaceae bacterium]MBP60983.1 hypothetical protein [Planctomycetaceae bacterium]
MAHDHMNCHRCGWKPSGQAEIVFQPLPNQSREQVLFFFQRRPTSPLCGEKTDQGLPSKNPGEITEIIFTRRAVIKTGGHTFGPVGSLNSQH